ncbi:Os01g0578901 [Oryza sativa Japonica Group]|uniref:Os01g0578901 protein n=2 Tax=Oryza TaxID=4527 RepID=A0A0P0V4H3_ORYSJ|nr:Os01g0578901 [Oryza sativa Japonica Group]
MRGAGAAPPESTGRRTTEEEESRIWRKRKEGDGGVVPIVGKPQQVGSPRPGPWQPAPEQPSSPTSPRRRSPSSPPPGLDVAAGSRAAAHRRLASPSSARRCRWKYQIRPREGRIRAHHALAWARRRRHRPAWCRVARAVAAARPRRRVAHANAATIPPAPRRFAAAKRGPDPSSPALDPNIVAGAVLPPPVSSSPQPR